MTWGQFQSSHAFCSSIAAKNGKEVTEAEIAHISALCQGTNVDCEVSPYRTQIWLGGLQREVVGVLDRLNSAPIGN